MKLYKKIASLLAVAALAAVLMPVCMAAPGDSIEARLNHAFALRASTEFTSRWTWARPVSWSTS